MTNQSNENQIKVHIQNLNQNLPKQEENKTQEKKEETKSNKLEINMEPMDFIGDIGTKLVSTRDLEDTISSLFSVIFYDYNGCKILVNDGSNPIITNTMPRGELYVNIYFKDRGMPTDDKVGMIKNIIARGSGPEKADLTSRVMRISGRNN